MLSKEKIKHLRSLHLAKFRNESGLFIAEGPKLAGELIRSSLQIHALYHTAAWNPDQAAGRCREITLISEEELLRISLLKTPNQVFAVCGIPAYTIDQSELLNGLTLLLDDIHDPGNLGTIIRIADWYGIQQLICSPDCVEVFNPKVVQSSMGSVFRVKVFYRDPELFLREYSKLLPVFGAYLDGENVLTSSLTSMGIIVIGSESHGIRRTLEPFITRKLLIPAFVREGGTHAESLNASVACGILLHEFRRREFSGQ